MNYLFMTRQVKKNPAEERKAGWADFRNVVWHQSACKILHPLVSVASTGYQTVCGDRVERNLAPGRPSFSGDYEEQ